MKFEEIYKRDIFANEAGITLERLDERAAVMAVTVEKRHLNGGSVAHGGLIFTLTDIAMAAMANYKQPVSMSIQSDIRFIAAALEGDRLEASAEGIFGRKRMYYCRCTVKNQNGEMIAIAEGMYHTKNGVKL